ncbi:hypothetical protein Q3G72_004607 [Acer saccharum]|nr:hypothetical protein Q3G72_004607 [Acer saccharum]
MGSEFRNSNGKSEIIKGKGDSIGNEGFELLSLAEFSKRRWLLKIRAWSVVLELISKKGMYEKGIRANSDTMEKLKDVILVSNVMQATQNVVGNMLSVKKK